MKLLLLTAVTALTAIMSTALSAQAAATATDSAGIRQAAHDYIDGYYTGDGARMERAVHPDLAKRIVRTNENGRSRLDQMSAMTLVLGAREGGGSDTPAAERRNDVTILDIYRNAASAKIYASGWVDYLHLAKWNGRWVIINVLWELHPRRSP